MKLTRQIICNLFPNPLYRLPHTQGAGHEAVAAKIRANLSL